MGLVSKDPNKGWGGNSDRCVITGAEATGTSRTLFGGRVKTGEAINGESSSVPTREDADRLASELPADRTGWDGGPLGDVDRRLYGLRESGYDGWIDQDGYPCDGPTFVRTDDVDEAS